MCTLTIISFLNDSLAHCYTGWDSASFKSCLLSVVEYLCYRGDYSARVLCREVGYDDGTFETAVEGWSDPGTCPPHEYLWLACRMDP